MRLPMGHMAKHLGRRHALFTQVEATHNAQQAFSLSSYPRGLKEEQQWQELWKKYELTWIGYFPDWYEGEN